MARYVVAGFIVLPIVLAGCTQDPTPGAPAAPPPANPAPSDAEPPRQPITPGPAYEFNLSDCDWGSFFFRLPKGAISLPGHTPWHNDYPLLTVAYDVMHCQRIGWPPLERGPISIVWEATNIVDDPPGCGVDESGLLRYVHQAYADDEDLARQLGKAMGIPVYLADISLGAGAFGSLDGGGASWTVPGQGASDIVLSPFVDPWDPVDSPARDFMLAYNGTHTSRLLLEGTEWGRPDSSQHGVGEYQAPTIMATAPSPNYHAEGSFGFNYEATATLTTWEGLGCTE